MTMKSIIFWDVTLCNLVEIYLHLRHTAFIFRFELLILLLVCCLFSYSSTLKTEAVHDQWACQRQISVSP
jgi:hypothetical protein